MAPTPKPVTSYRVSEVTRRLVSELADTLQTTKTDVIEQAIRLLATQKGVA